MVGASAVWFVRERLLKASQCFLESALVAVDVADVGVRFRKVRLSFQDLFIAADGFVGLALARQRVAEIHISIGIMRIEPYSFLVALHRLVNLFHPLQRDSEVEMDLRTVGIKLEGLPV